jgi:hypothetical protein
MAFYGATVDNVAIAAGQQVEATMSADFGADATGPSGGLFVDVCYQQQGGNLTNDGSFFGPLAAAQSTMLPFSVKKSFTGLAAGTYSFGMCACVDGNDPNAGTWATDFTWAEVRVLR